LRFGVSYKFRVEAQNSFGFSAYSDQLTLMCAHVPDKIFVPSTANANENVIINWNKPIEHGSAITGYKVYIRKSDLTFHYSEHVCDGTTLEALA
jgi:hypothetical protein